MMCWILLIEIGFMSVNGLLSRIRCGWVVSVWVIL